MKNLQKNVRDQVVPAMGKLKLEKYSFQSLIFNIFLIDPALIAHPVVVVHRLHPGQLRHFNNSFLTNFMHSFQLFIVIIK